MKVPKITLYQRGKHGMWWVRYTYHGFTYNYSIKTYMEKEAKQKKEDILYEIRHGLHRPVITLDYLWKRYRSEDMIHDTPSSQERDRISIKYLLAEFGNNTLDEENIRIQAKKYQQKRIQGKLIVAGLTRKAEANNATVNREIALLRHILNLATYEWNLLRKNPLTHFKMLKEKPRDREITADEWSRLISQSTLELRDFLLFSRSTGIRYGIKNHGILGLKWADINLHRKEIRVRDSKNHTGRILYMDDIAYQILKRRRESAKCEWIFPGKNGNRRSSFKSAFKGACKRAGIKNLRIHDIRHQFGSDKKSIGADTESLAILMGHKSTKTTKRYGVPNENHLRRIMESKPNYPENDCPNTVQDDDEK